MKKPIARSPKDSLVSPTGRPRRSDFKAHRYNDRTKEAVEFLALARYASIAHLTEHFGITMKRAHNIGYQLVRYGHAETRIVHNGMKAIWLTKSGMALVPHIDLNPPARPVADKPWGHTFAVATLLSKLRRGAITTPFTGDGYRIITEDQMTRAQWNLEKGDGVPDAFAPEFLPSVEDLRTPDGATGMEHGFILHNPRVSPVKHRPDLVIVRAGEQRGVIAFEVERQAKTLNEYTRIMRLYLSSGVYDEVCYLYADTRPSIARRVLNAAEAAGMNVKDEQGNLIKQRVRCVPYSELEFHAFAAGEVQTKNGLSPARGH